MSTYQQEVPHRPSQQEAHPLLLLVYRQDERSGSKRAAKQESRGTYFGSGSCLVLPYSACANKILPWQKTLRRKSLALIAA
jgi:hypothetical protein